MRFLTALILLAAATSLTIVDSSTALAAPPSAADALAQKFIDGPAAEASRERAAKQRGNLRQLHQKRKAKAAAKRLRQQVKAARSLRRQRKHRRDMEVTWQRRLDDLSEKLRRARLTYQPATNYAFDLTIGERNHRLELNRKTIPGGTQPELPKPEFRPQHAETQIKRVTVLMIMRARQLGRHGITHTVDPLVCLGANCYVSGGATHDARHVPRKDALRPVTSLNRRAGACRRTSNCAFRYIYLPTPNSNLQPIDLGWLRHDRHPTVSVSADRSCKIIKTRLSCREAIETKDYRLWIVPEETAERAGSAALTKALDTGLQAAEQHAATTQVTKGSQLN